MDRYKNYACHILWVVVALCMAGEHLVCAEPAENRPGQAVAFRQQRRHAGQERMNALRESQSRVLQESLAILPALTAAQQQQLIGWFQRYQGRLIEDEAAWRAQIPFLQETALDSGLSSAAQEMRLKQQLAVQSRLYKRTDGAGGRDYERRK